MACGICLASSYAGGWFGGYLGISSPEHRSGRIFSALITANLVGITVIALKSAFNLSLCGGAEWTARNVMILMGKTLALGVIYSIAVNYLLNRYIFTPSIQFQEKNDVLKKGQSEDQISRCCCKEE